ALPQEVRDAADREEARRQNRRARDLLHGPLVYAGLRAPLLVARRQVLEEPQLRPQVVADDVAVPALLERVEEIAHVDEEAGRLLKRLRAGAWRRIERLPARPTDVVDVRLDPGVRVTFADRVVVAEAVVRAAHEAHHVARRYSDLAEHHRHR